jgi:hypothetical protein
MKRLTIPWKALAIAGAIGLVTAVTGSALAMLDPGLGSVNTHPVERPLNVRLSGSPPSPLTTPTHEPEYARDTEFLGTVEVVASTGWTIDGHSVIVTGATRIKGNVQIGVQVKVEGRVLGDGTIEATEINVLGTNDNGNGNTNGNGNANENENFNGNVNGNENENENDNANGNGNFNDNSHDDDHTVNGNLNSTEDEHDGNHHNGNGDD